MRWCTAVEPHDLAWARALVAAARERHPDGEWTVLVVDDDEQGRARVEGAEVLLPLDLDDVPLDAMTLVYDSAELTAALTPWLMQHLARRTDAPVTYVAPQVALLRPLTALAGLLAEHAAVLVPRVVAPLPRDGRSPSEQDVLLSGTTSRALVAVAGAEGRELLAWWAERTVDSAMRDPARGFYLDQRLLDLVPGLFDAVLVEDPTWAVSRDDLAGRTLSRAEDGTALVDGEPVTFLDLTGYDVTRPHLLDATAEGRSRVLLSEQPVLRELCDEQRERVLAQPQPDPRREPPFARRNGVLVDDRVRALVRAELTRERRGAPPRPGPWDEPLGAWLASPDEESEVTHVGRYLASVYADRADLRAAFPELRSGRRNGFASWVAQRGAAEIGEILQSCPELVETAGAGPRDRALLSRVSPRPGKARTVPGVEVVGYLTAELGQGESARQFVAGLEAAGVEVSTSVYTRLSSRLGVEWRDREPAPGTRHDTVLLCVSPEALPQLTRDLGAGALRERYRIGLWFWELTEFPARLHPSLDLVDEIWVASRFNADTLRAVTDKPVVVVPHPTHAPDFSDVTLPELGDSDVPTFLFVFDYLSILERKNPMATIEAFHRAFPEPGTARLVIKSINGDRKQLDRERLRYLASGRDDIVLIERYLQREELDALMHRADCYVSLHRSEGFGQTLAESMAIGKPVIATAYSGNLEFTRPENSYLVPATLVDVTPGNAPYLPPAQWGDPDVSAAAAAMRAVVDDPDEARARGARARVVVDEEFSVPALARVLRERLREIDTERAASRPAAGPAADPDEASTQRRVRDRFVRRGRRSQ